MARFNHTDRTLEMLTSFIANQTGTNRVVTVQNIAVFMFKAVIYLFHDLLIESFVWIEHACHAFIGSLGQGLRHSSLILALPLLLENSASMCSIFNISWVLDA